MADKNPNNLDNNLKNDALEVNQQFMRENRPDSLGINTEKPKFPQYAVVAKRQESYKKWPEHFPIRPDRMVDAGLVFTGVGDSVRCYHCGGGLRNWEEGDDPWVEHAKWYPKCPHILLVRGQKYVDCIARGETPEYDGPSLLKRGQKSSLSDSQLLETVAAQSCLQNGYPKDQVLQAIKLFQKNNNGRADFEGIDILGVILELEDCQAEEAIGGSDSNQGVYNCCDNKECYDDVEEDQEELQKLHEENQRLKENQMCKICLDDAANIIFLPCGHMVSCPRCAPALNKCPLCRLPVSGTVKAYFE